MKFSSALDDRYDIKVNENFRVPLYICFGFEETSTSAKSASFYFVRLVAGTNLGSSLPIHQNLAKKSLRRLELKIAPVLFFSPSADLMQ